MKLYKSVLISIIAIAVSSCGSAVNLTKSSTMPAPDIGIEVQAEKYLEITAPNGWNSFKTDRLISLVIRNVSNLQIIAEPDFGIRVFARTDDEWIEVENAIIYEDEPFVLDPDPNYDPENFASTVVRPELPDYSVPYHIRIFVVGNLIESEKESKKVAAYIDLELNP